MSNNDTLILKLKNASICQNSTFILENINLEIHKGEFRYLIGKTGSGKSSLLKTLYADLPLKYGEGYITGHDLRELSYMELPYLRRKLGIIFQDFQLLMDRNIKNNLLFVLQATGWDNEDKISERIFTVLKKVGMQWSLDKMPHQLSGGEQQRIVIARALLNDPMLILADEPTGNLDPEVAEEILSLFLEINETDTTVLMATHNYNFVKKYPKKIFKCQNSQIYDIDPS